MGVRCRATTSLFNNTSVFHASGGCLLHAPFRYRQVISSCLPILMRYKVCKRGELSKTRSTERKRHVNHNILNGTAKAVEGGDNLPGICYCRLQTDVQQIFDLLFSEARNRRTVARNIPFGHRSVFKLFIISSNLFKNLWCVLVLHVVSYANGLDAFCVKIHAGLFAFMPYDQRFWIALLGSTAMEENSQFKNNEKNFSFELHISASPL